MAIWSMEQPNHKLTDSTASWALLIKNVNHTHIHTHCHTHMHDHACMHIHTTRACTHTHTHMHAHTHSDTHHDCRSLYFTSLMSFLLKVQTHRQHSTNEWSRPTMLCNIGSDSSLSCWPAQEKHYYYYYYLLKTYNPVNRTGSPRGFSLNQILNKLNTIQNMHIIPM